MSSEFELYLSRQIIRGLLTRYKGSNVVTLTPEIAQALEEYKQFLLMSLKR